MKGYDIYENNVKDSYTDKRCNGRVLHTIIELKVRPIILISLLEEIFTFTIHEDVALNYMLTD